MNGTIEQEKLNELKGKIYKIPEIDKTLNAENKCAEAKAVGDAIADLQRQINEIKGGA